MDGGEQVQGIYIRALSRVASILGGREELAVFLKVPKPVVDHWLDGNTAIPDTIFDTVVDKLIQHDIENVRLRRAPPDDQPS
jgi:hypothetical protein